VDGFLHVTSKNNKQNTNKETGGGFAIPAIPAYFEFWLDILQALN
jgi:hypothetical protein